VDNIGKIGRPVFLAKKLGAFISFCSFFKFSTIITKHFSQRSKYWYYHSMSYVDFFRDKKITLLGLGLLGRGVGDAEFLAQLGAQVLVTDKKSEKELAESVEKLKAYPTISFFLGGHRIVDFTQCDMVLKAAGVPLVSEEIKAAREAGVPVYMSTALFAKFARDIGATIVGVTGTRGKSTVSNMIFHTLKRASIAAHLGGNIRGLSTLSLLPEVKKDDICVLELDSWQLQGFGDLHISPHVAVFTNFMPDHLNYYPNMNAYFADKANIFTYQVADDVLIAGETIVEQIRDAMPPVRPQLPSPLPMDLQLLIPGEHNRANAALAARALMALKVGEDVIRNGLESFPGVEGRLQYVRDVKGVKIYNDNNATTPEATIAALNSFPERSIVLVCGGSDKGLDLDTLVAEIQRTCEKVVLLAGTGSTKLQTHIVGNVHDTLKGALEEALSTAQPGDVVLFSPGFASFGLFKNEYDRNDQFLALVKSLS
jgi:UDP-N-acetylmuramoylalanine--D-glutamate ligase